MPLCDSMKKGVTVLARVIDPDCQGKIVLLLYNRGKEEYVWSIGGLSWHLLVPLGPVESLKTSAIQFRTANGLGLKECRFVSPSQAKNRSQLSSLPRTKGCGIGSDTRWLQRLHRKIT